MLAGDKSRSTRGATLLPVIVGEEGSFLGDGVNIRCSSAHHTVVECTDIPHADIISHDDEDVGLLGCRLRHGWRVHQDYGCEQSNTDSHYGNHRLTPFWPKETVVGGLNQNPIELRGYRCAFPDLVIDARFLI